jgi:tRNA-dihydrouridine synthase B
MSGIITTMKSILNLQLPIIGLAPMDGVTDSPYRFINKKYGNPDLVFTEFTHVTGMCVAGDKIFHTFHYNEEQRPIVGQIYGKEPEYFYHAAKIICALGFDSLDINMGCPAKTVTASGAGAGLIRTPEIAKQIVKAVRRGIKDWVETGELTGLSDRSLEGLKVLLDVKRKEIEEKFDVNSDYIGLNNLKNALGLSDSDRSQIPVSIKTRIGYDQPITKEWISHLNDVEADFISVHGRTLKQMYSGVADWNEIQIAVETANMPVLANGDIKTSEDVNMVLSQTGAAGVLIGRGSYGNPWIFKDIKSGINNKDKLEVNLVDRVKTMLEHTEKFVELYPNPKAFFQMRKHFGWYMKSFEGAVETRKKLMLSNSLEEVREIISDLLV